MIVTTLAELEQVISGAPDEVVVDVENMPDAEPALANLLGVAVAWAGTQFYVLFNHWQDSHLKLNPNCPALCNRLREFLNSRSLMGWNIEHDREWVNKSFDINTAWTVDGRILWYLLDKNQTERGYGLKSAQKKILGWDESNDTELKSVVAQLGGRLDRGEHYLAPVAVLGRYACLDASSTWEVIRQLSQEAIDNDWDSLVANRDYARLLAKSTRRGVVVDEFALKRAKDYYAVEVQKASNEIRNVCATEIAQIESEMLESKKQGYKSAAGVERYMASPGRHPRFNPKSSQQREELLYNIVGLPILERTKGGKPSTRKDVISKMEHPSAKAFVALSENKKLHEMATSYFESCKNGLIHFPYDTVATVSERLGGYKPYALNMPFDSEPIMSAFSVRPGMAGVHMDLVSIEPCIIAGFSGDETMLKVYQKGLGDIYLDLCLDLFPDSESAAYGIELNDLIQEFHEEYDTNKPPVTKQKDKFGRIRKIAKIIQLAVGYTGTKFTVSKNLTAAGFPTSLEKADLMVYRYWEKFSKVRELSERLKNVAARQGYLNGVFGRKLIIPKKYLKDSLNRFSQHAGHVVLREIVNSIDESSKARNIEMHPLLPDIHDSTSWEVRESHVHEAITIFEDSIRRVSRRLCLPIEVRGEIKRFNTFYGLKNKE